MSPPSLTWFGHSAFCIELEKSKIFIDPFLTGNPAFSGSFSDVIAGTTHILLTHGHWDHIGDSLAIAQQTQAQICANFELALYLEQQGAPPVSPANTGGTVNFDEFTCTFTPAFHSSSAIEEGRIHYLGDANGLVLSAPHLRPLYCAGDTSLFSDMALIHELYAPKIGILPIGGRFTMDATTAALAVRKFFKFDWVIPCHYGSFEMLAPDAESFIAELEGSGTSVVVPEIGKKIPLIAY